MLKSPTIKTETILRRRSVDSLVSLMPHEKCVRNNYPGQLFITSWRSRISQITSPEASSDSIRTTPLSHQEMIEVLMKDPKLSEEFREDLSKSNLITNVGYKEFLFHFISNHESDIENAAECMDHKSMSKCQESKNGNRSKVRIVDSVKNLCKRRSDLCKRGSVDDSTLTNNSSEVSKSQSSLSTSGKQNSIGILLKRGRRFLSKKSLSENDTSKHTTETHKDLIAPETSENVSCPKNQHFAELESKILVQTFKDDEKYREENDFEPYLGDNDQSPAAAAATAIERGLISFPSEIKIRNNSVISWLTTEDVTTRRTSFDASLLFEPLIVNWRTTDDGLVNRTSFSSIPCEVVITEPCNIPLEITVTTTAEAYDGLSDDAATDESLKKSRDPSKHRTSFTFSLGKVVTNPDKKTRSASVISFIKEITIKPMKELDRESREDFSSPLEIGVASLNSEHDKEIGFSNKRKRSYVASLTVTTADGRRFSAKSFSSRAA